MTGQVTAAWRGRCFGLDVEGEVALDGCDGVLPEGERRRAVRFALGPAASVRAGVPRSGSEVIARVPDAGGRWREHVRSHPLHGHLITCAGAGAFHVDAAGERVVAAPAGVAAWRWQRAVVGEVLPFVAALRGLETLHASAVVLPGAAAAVAVCGGSGRGKTSIAAELILAGAALLADDVVAIEVLEGRAVVHPGAGLMSLRAATLARLGDAAVRRLGRVVGGDSRGVRVEVARHPAAVPLAALYLLEDGGAAPVPGLARIATPDLPLLLRTTFNAALTTPARLLAQLEAAAAIAATVRVVRVAVPRGTDPAEAAALIAADAGGAERG